MTCTCSSKGDRAERSIQRYMKQPATSLPSPLPRLRPRRLPPRDGVQQRRRRCCCTRCWDGSSAPPRPRVCAGRRRGRRVARDAAAAGHSALLALLLDVPLVAANARRLLPPPPHPPRARRRARRAKRGCEAGSLEAPPSQPSSLGRMCARQGVRGRDGNCVGVAASVRGSGALRFLFSLMF